MIRLLTDTASDLPDDLREKHQISWVPFNIIFGDEQYRDRIDLTIEEFFKKVKETGMIPKTAQVTKEQWMPAMKNLLKEPDDEVLVFTLSSTLSGTYEEAVSAAAAVEQERVHVVNSGATLLEAGMVIQAYEMVKEGKSAKKIADYFNNKPRQQGIFMIDTFEFLKKGGRIGYAKSVVGGLLNINPILKYNEEGKLVPWDKEKGTKKAYQKIAKYVKENRSNDYLMISHANNEEGANQLAALIEETTGEKPFIIAPMGAVIGTHTGPGCLFVSY